MAFADARKHQGHFVAQVHSTTEISPHLVRVTLQGEDLTRLPQHGYDQWFRLFLPHPNGETDFARVPQQFGFGGYLKYLRTKSGVRPPFRNYTVRELRRDAGEMDVDFVSHGDAGIAGPWARNAQPGEKVMLIDQGCGFDPRPDTGEVLLVGDESALPAVLGILLDLPREATGQALVELPDLADAQETDAPEGVTITWLAREDHEARPGSVALEALRAITPSEPARLHAYLAGEQALVTEGRRHLVAAGVPKNRIDFTGYWRIGKASA